MEEHEVSTQPKARPIVYASWSEGARRLDAEIQKNLETADERKLASIIAAIGHYECSDDDWQERPELFVKAPSCLEKLRELQRCLTRDNPQKRRVFLQLGSWNVLGKQIIPLLLRYPEDQDVFVTALKISVLLTVPVEPSSSNTYDQVEYLCQFKGEFREHNVLATILAHLEEPLQHIENNSLAEDSWRLLQLVLALFQNLLAIPERMDWVTAYPIERYSRLRDGLLECMFRESGPEIVLAIASHLSTYQKSIRRDNLLILQILHHMFWGQDPEALFKSATKEETRQAEERRKVEEEEKKDFLRKLQVRHSHFSGTFVRVEQDGRKTILARNPFQTKEDLNRKRVIPKKEKREALDVDVPLPSNDNVSVLLKSLADQFLATGGYNILMKTIKDDIERERKGLDVQDIVVFFQTTQFFTRYQHYKSQISADGSETVKHISSTMDDEMFTMVLDQWHQFLRSASSSSDWRSVVATGALLKDMIYILDMIFKKGLQSAPRDLRMAKTLLLKIFYDQTETGILNTTCKFIKAFNVHKHPRSHLTNLVAMTHVVLRLSESLTQEEGALIVSKRRRQRKTVKRKGTEDHAENATEANKPDVDENAGEKDPTENDVAEDVENAEEVPDSDNEMITTESTFDVSKCTKKFADGAVVSQYCWLLTFYDSNGPALNHYIISMLNRICKDFHLEPLLYQISTLEKFQAVLSDRKIAEMEEHQGLIVFVTKVVRNFFKKLQSNPLLYVEVLFPKSSNDCHEISADYMIHKMKDATVRRRCFSDALGEDEGGEDQPGLPSTQMGRARFSQSLGEDEGIEDQPPRSGAQVGSVQGVALRRKPAAPKVKRGPFNDEDEARIKELFERFKEKRSCSRLIAEALSPDGKFSGPQVARKLKQLGLHRVPSKSRSSAVTDSNIDKGELNEDNGAGTDQSTSEGEDWNVEKEDTQSGDDGLSEKGESDTEEHRSYNAQAPTEAGNEDTRSPKDMLRSGILPPPTKRKRLVKLATNTEEQEQSPGDSFNDWDDDAGGKQLKRSFMITDDD